MAIIMLSGPITGLPNHNKEAFNDAELALSAMGHTVLNPSNHTPLVNPDLITHEQYLSICFKMLDCCDTIYMLDGWQNSKGARMEYEYALERGMTIKYQNPPPKCFVYCKQEGVFD